MKRHSASRLMPRRQPSGRGWCRWATGVAVSTVTTGSIAFSDTSTRRAPNAFCPSGSTLQSATKIPIGRAGGFPVRAIAPFRTLILGGYREDVEWSWELALVAEGGGQQTRLISRNRVWLPRKVRLRFMMLFIEPAAFLMTRKMLLG